MNTHINKEVKQVVSISNIPAKMSQHTNTLFNHGFVAVGTICDIVDEWVMCDGKRVCGIDYDEYRLLFKEVE